MNHARKDLADKQKTRPRILIVDDEPKIRSIIADLIEEDFDSVQAENGLTAIEVAIKENPALILMDIIMPGISGIDACEHLRSHPVTKHIPVIMLSAAGQVENRIMSFDHGADDFIVKPFDATELMARIKGKLRRTREGKAVRSKILVCANLSIDQSKMAAYIDGVRLNLSNVELKLLRLLIKRSGRMISRKEILANIWDDSAGSDRIIDAHIVALRKKIEGFHGEIATVYGKGYCLRSEEIE